MSVADLTQPPGQPSAKSTAIAELISTGPLIPQDEKAFSHPETVPKPVRVVKETNGTEACSLTVTFTLIQRILTPEKHVAVTSTSEPSLIEAILPPLTSSNDVDIELYAILAIIIKDFVTTWFTRITTDHDFVEEITQIIAHCSRALEQRVRKVDIPALLLDEIPTLVTEHYEGEKKNDTRKTA